MSVLQRKAQAGKQQQQARAMTVPKALRLYLSKVADKLFDLPVTVIGIVPEETTVEKFSEDIDETSLLLVLDGPYRASGGVVLGHELVTALVQQQTMGKVLGAPDEPRKMTSTDAALCAPLIDKMIESVHAALESDDDKRLFALYRFGAKCQDKRLFSMALNANSYQTYKLTLELCAGAFQSVLTLCIPLLEPSEQRPDSLDDAEEPETVRKPGMYKTAMVLPAELNAVLMRYRQPLSTLGRLRAGDTISLPPMAFDNVELVTKTGRKICKGVMGQIDGLRALQLHSVKSERNGTGLPGTEFTPDGQEQEGPGGLGETDFGPGDLAAPDLAAADFDTAQPEAPDAMPDFETAAELPDLPEMETSGGMGDIGDLPDLPDLPSFDEAEATEDAGTLPDLPDLPELDDLPELSDLPKLNSA